MNKSLPQLLTVLISFVTSLVEALLSLRFLIKLFGASSQAPFVAWVYETTKPLLNPFANMFPSPILTGGLVIEFSTLFALIVYSMTGYLLLQLLQALKVSPKAKKG